MQLEERGARVSVVITTFKRAHMVGRAVRSVLMQDLAISEIIVVDDCSPDDTQAVIARIEDSKVRYIRHERNKGLPASRNTGLRATTGSYVAFLDDDDEWFPEKLSKELAAIDGCVAVLCGALVNGSRTKLFGGTEVTRSELRRGNAFDPSGLLVSGDLIRKLEFDEQLRMGEDWDAFIRISAHGRIGYVQEPLVLYSDGDHERMTNTVKFDVASDTGESMRMLAKHREFFGDFWYRYHCAHAHLMYLGNRDKKLILLLEAIHRFGISAVLAVLLTRLRLRLDD
jgi:glycosyltransferase involved in cell wall biosynthesis